MKTLLVLLGLSSAASARAPAQRVASDTSRARGVTYSVVMARVSISAQCVAGRGRIDIIDRAPPPTVLLDSIDFTPLGGPGDYYLFDSTTLILVRPKLHTFSAFALSDGDYNFDNGRAGWPALFDFPASIRVDTVKGSTAANVSPWPDGPIHVFWHLDVDWDLPTFDVVSRGRLTVASAPPGEATVARWVEPTLALGALAARDSTRFPNERFGLTSVTPISAHLGARLTNFVAKNRISALRLAKIDRSRFTIPPDFTEVPRSSASAMPPQNTAKWRAWP